MESTASLSRPGFRGLSGTALKAIALALMVLDHIHYFFEYTGLIPEWFSMLGRLAAPLFLFCAVEGFAHTHNRRKYFFRVWIIGAAMGSLLFAMAYFGVLVRPDGFYPLNGILLNFVVLMPIWQGMDWLRQRRIGRGLAAILIPILYPFALAAVVNLIPALGYPIPALGYPAAYISMSILPSWTSITDGGVIFILQGILLYALRSRRGWQMAAYAAVSLAAYIGLVGYQLTAQGLPLSALLTEAYQWMEIFAIPLMLCYNGQRGWGYQKLFYVFYPAHVYVLYALSWLLMVFAPQLAA